MLDDKLILEKLNDKFGEAITGFEQNYDIMAVYADKEYNLKILQFLYDEPELGFKFLTDLTAIHYPNNKGEELVMTYLVYNMVEKKHLRLKFKLNIKKPDIYTLTSLFVGANWTERECYDFYGVNFIGHPDLKRIMNVEEMDYFPMRKEYPLEDQHRKDKDDDMFGRGDSHFNMGKLNI